MEIEEWWMKKIVICKTARRAHSQKHDNIIEMATEFECVNKAYLFLFFRILIL